MSYLTQHTEVTYHYHSTAEKMPACYHSHIV